MQETRSHRPVLISVKASACVRFVLVHECLWEEIYLLQCPSSWDQKLLPWIRLGFMFSVAFCLFLSEYITRCSVLLRLNDLDMHLKSRDSVLIYIWYIYSVLERPAAVHQLSLCWYNLYLLRRDGRFRGLYRGFARIWLSERWYLMFYFCALICVRFVGCLIISVTLFVLICTNVSYLGLKSCRLIVSTRFQANKGHVHLYSLCFSCL